MFSSTTYCRTPLRKHFSPTQSNQTSLNRVKFIMYKSPLQNWKNDTKITRSDYNSVEYSYKCSIEKNIILCLKLENRSPTTFHIICQSIRKYTSPLIQNLPLLKVTESYSTENYYKLLNLNILSLEQQ